MKFTMKQALLLLAICSINGCGDNTKKKSARYQDPQKPLIDPIIGSWKSDCIAHNNPSTYGYTVYTFNSDRTFTNTVFGFKDPKCSVKFSDNEIKRRRLEILLRATLTGVPFNEASKFANFAVAPMTTKGQILDGTFSIGAQLVDETIELDTEVNFLGKNSKNHIVHIIKENKLYMTRSCLEISEEEECTNITGDSPQNREYARELWNNPHSRLAQ